MEKNKGEHKPVYFEVRPTEATEEQIFQSNGQYWEDRNRKQWDKLVPIFE